MTHKRQGLTLDDFPALKRWFAQVRARPAVQAGLAVGKDLRGDAGVPDEQARRVLFGLGAAPGDAAGPTSSP
jgi:GST-like protein